MKLPTNTKADEDEKQEYECLLLEGYPPEEAKKLARAANDKVNSRRLSGPLTGDTRNGHGVRPLISDMTHSYFWEGVTSLGVDERTAEQRKLDEANSLAAASLCSAAKVRAVLSPRQAECVILLFGLDGDMPRSYSEVGEIMGIKATVVENYRKRAMYYLRAHYGVLTEKDIAQKEKEKAQKRAAYLRKAGR